VGRAPHRRQPRCDRESEQQDRRREGRPTKRSSISRHERRLTSRDRCGASAETRDREVGRRADLDDLFEPIVRGARNAVESATERSHTEGVTMRAIDWSYHRPG
jgi:hypothetical protein